MSIRLTLKYLVLLFLAFRYTANAQVSITIQGNVSDVLTKKSIAGATVTLSCKDTTVRLITDEKGFYLFPAKLLKADKVYVLSAIVNSPIYGYGGNNECYVSTYGLGNNTTRIYERNIQLKQGVDFASAPVPSVAVHFKFAENTIQVPEKDTALNEWMQYLKNNPSAIVQITGYADTKEGNKSFRQMLSNARAQECANYLVQNDIKIGQIRLMGKGSDKPVITTKAIRKIKGKEAKMAARLLNCRAEISLRNMFFPPISVRYLNGLVTDVDTKLPVPKAFVKLSGSDGLSVSGITDSNGFFHITIDGFNQVAFYNAAASANGYVSTEQNDIFTITPNDKDLSTYFHNFQIEKGGYQRPFVFNPIEFDSGSVVLSKPAKDSLNVVSKIMTQRPNIIVEFMGDADWHEYNYIELANERAKACVNYLTALGVDSARFIAASRLNETAITDEEKTTNSIVKHREKQKHMNLRKCNAAFWVLRWDYGKPSSQ